MEQINKVSIIMVTYNQLDYTKVCVQSIRENVAAGTYEMIVVDNRSEDGTRAWLKEQPDMKCVFNEENRGFPAACNQGAAIAEAGNDILLLNNDTIVCKNSIYNMQRALTEEKTGAVGACSNSVGARQRIDESFQTIEEYIQYAEQNNVYDPFRHQKRLRLIGFALLIKRDLWDDIGGLDEVYGLGNFEDDDICLNILKRGYHLCFCPDAFIFHFGGTSFKLYNEKNGSHAYDDLLLHNRDIFEEKWGIRWGYFSHPRNEIVELIKRHPKVRFRVLDIGCGLGGTLQEIGNRYPRAELYGAEINQAVVDIASHYLNVCCADIEQDEIPFETKFDYIILADILEHTKEPEKVLLKLKKYLTSSGAFIISLPNIMHISIMYQLLHGRFRYTDEGILDRTHLRFFALTDMLCMLEKCGLRVERVMNTTVKLSAEQEQYLDLLCQMDPAINREEMLAYQYQFVCRNV